MRDSKLLSLSLGNWLALFLVTIGLYWVSRQNFLLFHGLVELFSIVVAFGIFILAWNSRRILRQDYLLFLGIAYLYVGGLDLIHTISYKGMGIVDHGSANLATQLWIGARFTEGLALVLALLFFERPLKPVAAITLLGMGCGLLLWTIGIGLFPVCFIEGQGLTRFKINSEYCIIAILLAAFLGLRHYRQQLEEKVYRLLSSSILFGIGSELAFTRYAGVYGLSNLAGHLCKFLSFYLVYKALIETGLKKPYALLSHEMKQKESLLIQSEKEFRAMFEMSAVGLAQVDPRSQALLRVNDKFCRITGYDPAELGWMTVADLTHPEDRQSDQGLSKDAVPGGREEMTRDLRYIRKDGVVIWVRMTTSVLREENSEVLSAMAIITDITESRAAEEALRESEQKLKLIADSVKDVIWMSTPGNKEVTFINKAYEEVWGRSCASLYERPWSFAEAIHPEDRGRVLADAVQRHAGGEWKHDYRIVCPDGSERWINDNGTPILDKDGKVCMMVGVARDITERKGAEEERRRHNEELEEKVARRTRELEEKVVQVRTMAMQLAEMENQERRQVAEVLHGDLQQLLAAGTMQAERLLTRKETLSQQTRQLEFVTDVLKKAHGIARSLSHDLSPPILEHGGINDILQWLADRHRELYGLEVLFTPAADFEITSESLKTIIYRFVQELLTNVVKHAGVGKAWLTLAVDGGRPCVTVLDHGCGFDPRILKGGDAGGGSGPGLGLLAISERLRMLGGAMEIDSTPGQGSRCTLMLPPVQA